MTLENAIYMVFEGTSVKDRKKVSQMSDFEKAGLLGSSVQQLYDSLLDKSRSKLDEIDTCKGDITKFHGYDNMVACLDSVSDMIKNTRGVNDLKELNIVKQAINNIVRQTEAFTTSYKLERDFGQVIFRMLVAACVESTSIIIASVIEFLKDSQSQTIAIVRNPDTKDYLPIMQLEKFNTTISTGEFTKVMNAVNSTNKEKLVGGVVAIPFVIVGAVVGIVILLRELAFYYYYSRMKVSQFCDHQKDFLEYNIAALESDRTIDAAKKKEIIRKQKDVIKKLEKASDKIKVNHKMTAVQARDQIRKEKETYTLDTATTKTASNTLSAASASGGFRIL